MHIKITHRNTHRNGSSSCQTSLSFRSTSRPRPLRPCTLCIPHPITHQHTRSYTCQAIGTSTKPQLFRSWIQNAATEAPVCNCTSTQASEDLGPALSRGEPTCHSQSTGLESVVYVKRLRGCLKQMRQMQINLEDPIRDVIYPPLIAYKILLTFYDNTLPLRQFAKY
jgi:hypothetical protein